MNTKELLTKADKLTAEIFNNMTRVEQCDEVAKKIENLVPVFLNEDGCTYTRVDNVLDQAELASIRDKALGLIKSNRMIAEDYLTKLVGGSFFDETEEVVEEVTEEVVETVTEEVVEEVAPPAEVELDYDVVKYHVQKTTSSYREIADKLNVPYKKLYSFIEKNGLKRPKAVKGDWRG